MSVFRPFWMIIILLFPVSAIFAEEENKADWEDIWVCVGAETSFYSTAYPAIGGSLSFGYGSGLSLGVKLSLLFNDENIDTLELSFLLRLYLSGIDEHSGPYLQLLGGPVFFNRDGLKIPSDYGIISVGFCFGWRFIFYDNFFVEPSIRTGFPYIFGVSVSSGVRF
ncbi:MAG: hypothetical protein FWD24_01250 [Treponema sp.]|nr:hypothetical protein [Treponema sp.]